MKILDFMRSLKRAVLVVETPGKLNHLKNSRSSINRSFTIEEPYNLSIHEESNIKIGVNVLFRSFCSITTLSSGKLIISDNVFFNNYCSLNCLGEIMIGKNTIFGEGVKIYDHNHQYDVEAGVIKIEREQFKICKVRIGENCWIGSNVTILSNVTIGDNVIIGANNLIYKSVPSNTIVKADVKLIFDSKQ